MPFERSAFARSVDKLVSTDGSPTSKFESGYLQWQAANGGAFTIGIQEAIDVAFKGIASQINK